jgi:uroporphyrinogen III methyltransferase/synthase
MTGKVFLVGAGPGDPSLITVKGLSCLKKADVVLYDYLAHPTLLTYCKSSCLLVDVGKKKGHHRQTQDQINQHLVSYAQNYKVIVRLKGGDPLIFGRGGEELSVLVDHHIPFEIVPGVTSAIAGPAYAGIPLTHRELSRSVAFVTGSLQKGENAENITIPIADTLVFLMPVTHLSMICSKLKGMDKFNENTPCALIHHASTSKQYTVVGTLETIIEKAGTIQTPTLFVVGNVVSYADTFDWVSVRPLQSRRIVLLRSKQQSQKLMESLLSLGAEVIHFPLLQFSKNQHECASIGREYLAQFDAIAFSSQNGVDYFFDALLDNNLDTRLLSNKYIFSIGSKTTQALNGYGIIPDKEASISTSAGLIHILNEDKHISSVLYPTSTLGVSKKHEKCNKKITKLGLYKTIKPEHFLLTIEDGDWVVFTSPSSVTHFFEGGDVQTKSIIAFCIGSTTEKELSEKFHGTIIIAENPSSEGLVSALLRYQKENDV